MTAEPPLNDGACQDASSSWIWLPLVTVRPDGAVGAVAVTAAVAALVRDSPLFAWSVNETLTLMVFPRSLTEGVYVEAVASWRSESMVPLLAIHW